MPGPLVHKASAEALRKLLRGRFPLEVRPEWYMRPDLLEQARPGTHAGYNAVTRRCVERGAALAYYAYLEAAG